MEEEVRNNNISLKEEQGIKNENQARDPEFRV
jgi:hypothetical protein